MTVTVTDEDGDPLQITWAVDGEVRQALRLSGEHRGTGFSGGEDAGIVQFAKLMPQDAWALRIQIARAIANAGTR